MERKRSFQAANKRVPLRELTDLLALRLPQSGEAPQSLASAGGKTSPPHLASSDLSAIAPEVPLPQVRAFENAGWHFVRRSEMEELPPSAQTAKVFVKPGGRLALGTDRLTVQLRQDVLADHSPEEILEDHGCRVIERLSFAPGLFRVAVTDQAKGDAVDVANELVKAGVCEFAEPELIEFIGGR